MAVMVLRKFRLLLDVLWGSPNDGDIPTYDAGLDKLVMAAPTGGGVTDHGALTGLSDNDHPQYALAADVATDAELAAHLNDTADAHDASAISILDTANDFAASDVEGALAELQTDHEADAQALADHLADSAGAHAASAISLLDTANDFTATDVEGAIAELQSDAEADATALADHLADTADAHDASAISFTPAGTLASTNVQAAIEEVASEAGGSPWSLSVDLPLSSLTDWSSNAGTWAINGGVIENTAGSDSRLEYDPLIRLSHFVVEAEIQVGAGAYMGFAFQTDGGTTYTTARLADDNVVYVQWYSGTDATLTVPGGVSQGVWYKLRVYVIGPFLEVFVDDVFLGSVNSPPLDRRTQKFVLHGYNPSSTVSKFRNLKIWNPTLPA